MDQLAERIGEVADSLRLKSQTNPFLDDLWDLASELYKIQEELSDECEES